MTRTIKARLPERECPRCRGVVCECHPCRICGTDGKLPGEVATVNVHQHGEYWYWKSDFLLWNDEPVGDCGPYTTPAEAKAGALRTLGAVEVTE